MKEYKFILSFVKINCQACAHLRPLPSLAMTVFTAASTTSPGNPLRSKKPASFMSSLPRFAFYIGPFFTCGTDRTPLFRIVYPKHRKLASLLIYRCRAVAAPGAKADSLSADYSYAPQQIDWHTMYHQPASPALSRAIACSEVSSSIPLRAKYCKISLCVRGLHPSNERPIT